LRIAHAGRPSVIAYRLVLCALAAMSAVLSAAGSVEAQAYPDRLIKMVVPYPPGGPIDTTARLVVQRLGPILGQTVIIENRAGAGGALGTKAGAGAEPDGYTPPSGMPAPWWWARRSIAFATTTRSSTSRRSRRSPRVMKCSWSRPTSRRRTSRSSSPTPRLVPASSTSAPWATATSLTSPRNCSNCRPGPTSSTSRTRRSPEAVAGIVAGEVHILFGEVAGLLPLVRAGKIRALGVASATRNALAPDLPTMIEGGIPDFVALTFTGVVAPAGTSATIVAKLNAAINESLKSADIVAALGKLGAEVRTGSAQEFAAFIA